MPELVRVHADNVVTYVMAHGLEQGWDDLRNFVCSRCPFEETLLQFTMPASLTKGIPYTQAVLKVKELSAPLDFDPEQIVGGYKQPLSGMITGKGLPVEKLETSDSVNRLKKFQEELNPDKYLRIDVLMPGENYKVGATSLFGLSTAGKILEDKNGVAYLRFAPRRESNLVTKFQNVIDFMMIVGLATLNFMNCRNVELVDNKPSRQQRRFAERMGNKLPVTYKTLVLHPFGKRNRFLQKQQAGPMGDTALHIVRGHFKDYRGGEGLGRAHARGLWWWGPQVRGTNPERVVEKDYSMELGNEKSTKNVS